MDGPLHEQPERQTKDAERDAILRRHGFRILRFEGDAALGRVLDEIRQALATTPLPTLR
jgi:very-short-patch-repair endonuclease